MSICVKREANCSFEDQGVQRSGLLRVWVTWHNICPSISYWICPCDSDHFIRDCGHAIISETWKWALLRLTVNHVASEDQINRIKFHLRSKVFYQCKVTRWIDGWIHLFQAFSALLWQQCPLTGALSQFYGEVVTIKRCVSASTTKFVSLFFWTLCVWCRIRPLRGGGLCGLLVSHCGAVSLARLWKKTVIMSWGKKKILFLAF